MNNVEQDEYEIDLLQVLEIIKQKFEELHTQSQASADGENT